MQESCVSQASFQKPQNLQPGMLRLVSSAAMAATRSNIHPVSSSSAAPSFRALSRLFCSSQGKSACSSMVVVDSQESCATATDSIHSKVVEDKKLVREFFLYQSAWFGPRWRMPFEFEEVRKKYPNIPAERVDISVFLGKGRQPIKFLGFLEFTFYSVIVKANYRDQEVIQRTMLVMGRDVKELEAAVERLNKFRSLLARLNDLIWNRKQQ